MEVLTTTRVSTSVRDWNDDLSSYGSMKEVVGPYTLCDVSGESRTVDPQQ